ncbi:DUF262 domain-containing protein [Hyphomicrobium sp. MC1]|uniref:DUF262 domain-containing protein n=1 Tax=Hyphomicrobium sp. (strain MC1) TaxID=717785 RepID=UPI000213F67B|nr:DUF262 domain-containing protein [Hyphomicrobium sp. MC1]CCB64302.1 conserved protein of unknown function [Hyphomicrobium sp. MC1]
MTKRKFDVEPRDEEFEEDEPRERPEDLAIAAGDFGQLLVAPSDWTIQSLLHQIGKQIDLNPEFQRRGVWSRQAKSSFIESLFLNIPIPQILLAAKKDNRNSFIVLDGKQRLLTIKQFYDGVLDDGSKFVLSGLRVLTALEGKDWSEISQTGEWADRFLNTTQRTAVLRGWDREDVLYEIFHRLNSGSVKLSPMELRMSLYPGGFLKHIISWSEKMGAIHELLRLKHPDKRMSDVEIAVRHLAFGDPRFVYDGNLKKFLDDACRQYNVDFMNVTTKSAIEDRLAQLEDSIREVISIFGIDNACRKWKGTKYERRFNRAIFDIQVGSLASSVLRNIVSKDRPRYEKLFQKLSEEDDEFVRSMETTTKSVASVRKRFGTWYNAIKLEYKVDLVMAQIADSPNASSN